jgi:alkaline phosphatase/streptomycin-6-phosphatase
MTKPILTVLLGALLCGSLFAQQQRSAAHARNIIFLIGDGMGEQEITLARNYQVGAAGRLTMDTLPVIGLATTYSLQEKDPSKPNYVTDSAAGATAWTTGHKTSNGRISTAAGNGAILKTILEIAQERGYRTGNITTAELTDATPAALGAHVNDRRCQGPAEMDRCPQFRSGSGGAGSIAEQLVNHKVDVLLGGGRQRFAQTIDAGPLQGKTVIEKAQRLGYQIVSDAAELKQAAPGKPVLGLFSTGNMSSEWIGEAASPFPGSGPQQCREGRRNPNEPSLADMTTAALRLLSGGHRGFFLQVEGGQIDKFAHVARPCEQIGETIAFDATVKIALDFAARTPGTLVIVTADHGHSTQIIPQPTDTEHSPGLMSTLLTKEGAPLYVLYATNAACCQAGHIMEHTGVPVRVAASGPGASALAGVHDMTDVFHVMARALGAE